MKKLLGILILGLLWCNVGVGEVTSGDLTTSWKYDSSWDKISISAYNANSSKSITITKMKIWFSNCSSKSGDPDRIFNVNKLVRPYSQREIYWYVDLPSGSKCANISHKVNEPTTSTWKPKKEKTCSETNYEEPCTCEKEANALTKKYCEVKKKKANKLTRSEAASYCASRAEEYSKEIGAEYYKDCMKDEGF